MTSFIVAGVLPFVLAAGGAWLMSRYAFRFGLIDLPNDRSSHGLPTPRGGGIGILAAFFIVSMTLKIAYLFWLPATFLSLISFFDDTLDLSPAKRLACQFFAALAVVLPVTNSLPVASWMQALLVCSLAVFIVGSANFYNFMDGINGIAAMTGVVAFSLLAFVAAKKGGGADPILFMALAAACLGFLPFNVPRARVFMGDVGSVLLGFVFASAVLRLSGSPAEFIALTGCLFPFYADCLSTLYVRWRSGERLSQAHRRHLYQIMANQRRIPHWQISGGYCLLQSCIGGISIFLSHNHLYLAAFLASCLTVWFFLMAKARRCWEQP